MDACGSSPVQLHSFGDHLHRALLPHSRSRCICDHARVWQGVPARTWWRQKCHQVGRRDAGFSGWMRACGTSCSGGLHTHKQEETIRWRRGRGNVACDTMPHRHVPLVAPANVHPGPAASASTRWVAPLSLDLRWPLGVMRRQVRIATLDTDVNSLQQDPHPTPALTNRRHIARHCRTRSGRADLNVSEGMRGISAPSSRNMVT